MDFLFFSVGILCGLFAGYLLAKKSMVPVRDLSPDLNALNQDHGILRGRLEALKEENGKLTIELQGNQDQIYKLSTEKGQYVALKDETEKLKKAAGDDRVEILKLTTLNSTLEERQKGVEEKINDLTTARTNLTKEFENLANKIFQEKMTHFHKDSTANIDTVLKPFKEKLGEFQAVVSKYREDEIKESTSLKTEIQNIFNLNLKLSTEAQNLTKALKGDKKAQGNWGELILERVLEASGLQEGEDYILQGKDMGLANDDGRALKPDVIVNLPEGKHIIVDSKVTLNGYESYVNSEDDVHRTLAIKEFLGAIKNHINGLSGKQYQKLANVVSQDFVLMFIPIEGAFATALQNDSGIFMYGWDRKIILVSPTTLMVTLRTIQSIWRQEKQNKNTLDIVKQAEDLYDKFIGFVDSLQDLDSSLKASRKNFDEAMNRAKTGKGNLFGRFEKLKDLGLKPSKQLKVEYEED